MLEGILKWPYINVTALIVNNVIPLLYVIELRRHPGITSPHRNATGKYQGTYQRIDTGSQFLVLAKARQIST